MKKLTLLTFIFLFILNGKALSEKINKTLITDDVFTGASGIVGVNMASGDNHVQSNMRVINLGSNGYTLGFIEQQTMCINKMPTIAIDLIGGNAFSHIKGVFSINQASGSGSAEANFVSISIGKKLENLVLAQTVAKVKNQDQYSGEFLDIICRSAFFEAKGVVQVNQSAGGGNALANTFHLNFIKGNF